MLIAVCDDKCTMMSDTSPHHSALINKNTRECVLPTINIQTKVRSTPSTLINYAKLASDASQPSQAGIHPIRRLYSSGINKPNPNYKGKVSTLNSPKSQITTLSLNMRSGMEGGIDRNESGGSHQGGNTPDVSRSIRGTTDKVASRSEDIRPPKIVKLVRKILSRLRSQHTIGKAKAGFVEASHNPAYVVFENATGGCFDTISLGLAGFRHAGGTEDVNSSVGTLKGKCFEDLSGARC